MSAVWCYRLYDLAVQEPEGKFAFCKGAENHVTSNLKGLTTTLSSHWQSQLLPEVKIELMWCQPHMHFCSKF